jgi:UDP-N-acetyl-D-mannosaminuronic acid transferase (WecB/TagA/CpsF family)
MLPKVFIARQDLNGYLPHVALAMKAFQTILGINFFIGDLEGLLELCSQGHFIVVPSAPSLVDMTGDNAYREAVEKSDFAVTDSGLMVLLWRLLTGQSLIRLSGLKLLRGMLNGPELKQPGASLWIMPSENEKTTNLSWFEKHEIAVQDKNCYVAPMYPKGPIVDPALLAQVEALRPRYVIINLGGGVQERVGYYLKRNLSFQPTILCVGAAIAFITGIQANIPAWADRWMLGWLFRCLQAPHKFVPRYWKAMRLIGLLFKYRERSVAS